MRGEPTLDVGKPAVTMATYRNTKDSTPYDEFDLSDHNDDSAHDAQQRDRLNSPTISGKEPSSYPDASHKSTPPISRGLADLSIRPSAEDMTPSPSIAYTTSGSSTLADPQPSACKQLIGNTFPPHEVISLIEAIFASKAEITVVRDLRGEGAQKFIDVVHEVRIYTPLFLQAT